MTNQLERPAARTPFAGCALLFLVLAVAGIAAVYVYRNWFDGTGLNPNAQPRVVEARGKLSDLELANINVYEVAAPSVVQVTTRTQVTRNWYNFDVQTVPKGVGSGFIWDQDGHIVTNYHVVSGADVAQVTLADHSTYEASRYWAYPDQDIAVLVINAPKSKLHPIRVGTSHDLKVGQLTYALGDPFGFDQTMTTGIVSALGRTIESSNHRAIEGVIQTSAAINPGNSGGPLLDSAGRLIGMNTAIASPSGAFAGIGFAIPVDEINRVAPQLIKHGKIVRPRLGVQLASADTSRQLGVERGALVVKVIPESGAAKAGIHGTTRDDDGKIQLGDIVVAIDGKAIENAADINPILQEHRPGDTVTVTVVRAGKREDFKVKLSQAD